MAASSLELDLDVDARREVESHERVDRLRRGVEDVDEALVRAHLEVLAAVLVLVRRADDAVHVLLGRQRHRARDLGARTRHRLDDLARRAVDDLVVVGLEPDADLLSRHGGCTSCLLWCRWVVVVRFAVRRSHPRWSATAVPAVLLEDLGDAPGADGPAALADGELEALLHGDGLDEG